MCAPDYPAAMKTKFAYTGIRVRDLEKSLHFYTKLLGMKESRKGAMDHGRIYVGLRTVGSSQELELNWYPPGSRFASSYEKGEELDHLAFVVNDVKAAFKELVAKGAQVAIDPDHAKNMEVYVKDPDGIWIELLSS